MTIRSLAGVVAVSVITVACASSAPDDRADTAESNATTQCTQARATNPLNLRRTPELDAGNIVTLLPPNTALTIKETSADGAWYRVSTALGEGWVAKAYVACTDSGDGSPTAPSVGGRADADFVPASCADCLHVRDGEIRLPDGTRFVALGANLPMLRDGDMTHTDWNELKARNVKVVRMFAAGGNLSSDATSNWSDDWANKVAARVDEASSKGFRVIVSFADYYHALPGETLVGDNAAQAEWCGMSVRPWPWYRRGTPRFDFDSACEGKTLRAAPSYEVFYKPFALKIVERLKDHPGVFGWAIGNELRALGRGGKGAQAIAQGAAIDTFAGFLEDMIGSIRAVDKNHLIIPGVQNLTEISDDQAHGSTWNAALERMMKVPFNVWNITMYNDNANARADIAAFRARHVPVIATEYDYWSPMCDADGGEKMGDHACAVMKEGLSMVAPWARSEMESVCSNTGAAWDGWGYLGGTRMQSECR